MEKKDQTQGGAGFSGYTKNTYKSQQITASEMKQEETKNNSTAPDNECNVREQDRFMPLANVIRLMRKVIPRRAKISDDAKETIQECVSEFISFVTSEANVRCQQEHRKTITAEDLLWAMSSLGFDNYVEPLTVYINRYRESEAGGGHGSFRGEAFVKRSVDTGVMPIAAAFPPVYYMAPNGGFLGAMAMGGFLMDCGNAGPSGTAAANTPEIFTKCEE